MKKKMIFLVIIILMVTILGYCIILELISQKNKNKVTINSSNVLSDVQNKLEASQLTEYLETIFNEKNEYNVVKSNEILKPIYIIDSVFNSYDEYEDFYLKSDYNNTTSAYFAFYETLIPRGDAYRVGLATEYTASSTYNSDKNNNYSADNLGSIFTNTCWAEGVNGDGTGEKIKLKMFGSNDKIQDVLIYNNNPRNFNDVLNYISSPRFISDCNENEIITNENMHNYYSYLNNIAIINGYAGDDNLWKKNNRVKKMKLVIDNKLEYILELEDTKSIQLFEIYYKNERFDEKIDLTFEILEVYSGSEYDDTCLTSIYPIGYTNIKWGGR